MLNHTCIFTFFSIELKKKQKHQLVEFYIFGLLTVPYAVSRCNWKYFHFLLLCIYIKMTTLNHMHLKVFFYKKGGGGWSPGQVVRVLVWFFFKIFFMSILQLSLSLSQKCFQYVNPSKSVCVHSLLKKIHVFVYTCTVELSIQSVHGSQII